AWRPRAAPPPPRICGWRCSITGRCSVTCSASRPRPGTTRPRHRPRTSHRRPWPGEAGHRPRLSRAPIPVSPRTHSPRSPSSPRPVPGRAVNGRPRRRPRRAAIPPGRRLPRGSPAQGSAVLAAHVQPDDGPGRLAGPDLHEVTHLVDHPQALAGLLRGAALPPGERVGDPALVLYLADDLLTGVPDPERPARA